MAAFMTCVLAFTSQVNLGKVFCHNDESDEFHLDLFDPVCLHHEISAEHNMVIMVFSTPWMMLNHSRAYNSGVPVQVVYGGAHAGRCTCRLNGTSIS